MARKKNVAFTFIAPRWSPSSSAPSGTYSSDDVTWVIHKTMVTTVHCTVHSKTTGHACFREENGEILDILRRVIEARMYARLCLMLLLHAWTLWCSILVIFYPFFLFDFEKTQNPKALKYRGGDGRVAELWWQRRENMTVYRNKSALVT